MMVAIFTATAQGSLWFPILVHSREFHLLMHPIHLYKCDNLK